jgi:YidC/Oxa1 family membrane protein insertase
MQAIGSIYNHVIIIPILNVIVALYQVFLFVGLPGAFGFAIIALTALIRIVMQPLFHSQITTAAKMQELKPHLDKIQAKHKKDPQKLQAEQMRLYQEAGVNPASGCLLLILQLPVLIGVYNTISLFVRGSGSTKVMADINNMLYHPALQIKEIDPWFLWYNLGITPAHSNQWHYYLIPVITGALQFWQGRVSMPAPKPVETKELKKGEKKAEEPTGTGADFQKAMNMQMKFIFPVMIGYFSYNFPVGLALYWNIFSLFSILQYRKLNASKK